MKTFIDILAWIVRIFLCIGVANILGLIKPETMELFRLLFALLATAGVSAWAMIHKTSLWEKLTTGQR